MQGEELESCIRDRERAIRQWGVGRDFADSLGRAQRGLAGQLAAVGGVLATKLDKVNEVLVRVHYCCGELLGEPTDMYV